MGEAEGEDSRKDVALVYRLMSTQAVVHTFLEGIPAA